MLNKVKIGSIGCAIVLFVSFGCTVAEKEKKQRVLEVDLSEATNISGFKLGVDRTKKENGDYHISFDLSDSEEECED